jgi:hypothetical protein
VVKLLALGALLAIPGAARADGIKMMSFGEGGGYKHPDAATQQYLDGAAQNAANSVAAQNPPAPPTPPAPPAPAAPTPAAGPAATAPSAPASAAPAPQSGPHTSLWNGVVRPLDAGDAAVEPDDAREGAERDYETRVLGLRASPKRPALASAAAPALVPGRAVLPPAAERRLFVSFEIDPREAGDLRDAVAGLGAAGFAPDARFEAAGAAGPGGIARVSGWLPAANLAEALKRPGIKSVSVEPGARPSLATDASSEFLVGLRVGDPASARADIAAGLRGLADAAGFRLKRVVGLETAPDGRSVALVEGRLTLARLPQALASPGVIQIAPLLPAAPEASAADRAARGVKGFARYAFERGLWLILLTLAVSLPSLRSAAARVATVFSPYR